MKTYQCILKNNEKTQEDKDTMEIDIDKIDTYEIINKVEEAYFTESGIFSDDFIQKWKDNLNEAQLIPIEIKIT